MPHEAATELAADPVSVRQARAFVSEALKDWDAQDLADQALLLTSEVVTNAVLYSRGGIRLSVTYARRVLRVEVSDTSPALPQRRHTEDVEASGRGLLLVDAIATRWGVEVTPGEGKHVWFEVTP